MPPSEQGEAKASLELALDELENATGHSDPAFKALAHYEKSKTYYQLSRLFPEDATAWSKCAREEADRALDLSTDKKYQTWRIHLQSFSPTMERSRGTNGIL